MKIKKTLFGITILGIHLLHAQSKLYVKGNAIFAPVGIINIGVEKQLSQKYTLQVDAFVSPWKSFAGKNILIGLVGVDVRYYFKEAFKHWYVAGNFSTGVYNVQKWNYWNDNYFQLDKDSPVYIKNNLYQKGFSFMLGATVGYQFQLNERWNMDIYAGGGNVQDFYKGYDKISGDRYDDPKNEREWNRSGEWIPYRGGVMVSYQIK